jgi:hypothetical protein
VGLLSLLFGGFSIYSGFHQKDDPSSARFPLFGGVFTFLLAGYAIRGRAGLEDSQYDKPVANWYFWGLLGFSFH